MTNDERKAVVRKLLQAGRSLSEIQDHLRKECHDSITYMELRLLLAEMPDTKLPEKEFPKPVLPVESASPAKGAAAAAPPPAGGGSKLSISVDQLPAPGAMLSGFVRFASGAKAHWFLDGMGRLGLEPELGSGKPTTADMKEFSAELKRMLEESGGM